ncbi:MAG: FGGY family carbohydrate kinase [Pseudomonadota bacterium]
MSWSYVIVLDQGTHSTRAIIYNESGDSIFKSQREVDLFYRDTTHVEQNGQNILNSCQFVMSEAHAYVQKNNLVNIAIAITTQRSTVIAWDKDNGEAISPALSWMDTRASGYLNKILIDEHDIKKKTGLPLSPHYGASKLKWLLEHDKNVMQMQKHGKLMLGPLAAFLIYNLVKQQPNYLDYSNAHRTLLWNLETRAWDQELLDAFSIDPRYLPQVVPNEYHYGIIKELDFPLVMVNGDQNSAVYGYGVLDTGTTFTNIGTGAFVLAKSEQRPILNTELLASITYSSEQTQNYALEGTVNGAGAAMTWAENAWGLSNIESIEWKDVFDVPIFLNTIGGLGSPFWKSNLKPRFLDAGKTYNDYTTQQCMAALMESIAFLLAINIEEMNKYGIETKKILVSGGMSKDHHLCQCLANILSVSVQVSNLKEATSRGAAWLTMQQPKWDVIERNEFQSNNDEELQSRYVIFKREIVRLTH